MLFRYLVSHAGVRSLMRFPVGPLGSIDELLDDPDVEGVLIFTPHVSSPESFSGVDVIGQSVIRREDPALVRGKGQFVADLPIPGLLHARFVRSDVAHGELIDLDTTAALESSGVMAVMDGHDFPVVDLPIEGTDLPRWPRPLIARDRVRFLGECIAVVIASTEREAFDAADLVWPDIEPLEPVATAGLAVLDQVLLYPDKGTNVVERLSIGNLDVLAPWAFDVDLTVNVRNQRLAPTPIEPLAALAQPTDEGISIWVGHQAPHTLRDSLIEILEVPVRVIVPDVGGGFGMKGRFFPEYAVLASAALRLGRPIRWLQTRRESMLASTHGRDMVHTVRIAGDRDGRIRRVKANIRSDVGAYPHTGAQVPRYSILVAQEVYDIAEFGVELETVVTTTAPTAPYRGAGRPEAAYAMERAVESFARACQLDPLDIRRRNFIDKAALPRRTATGALYDSGDYRLALDRLAQLVRIDEWREEQLRRRMDGLDPIGVGLGAFVERAGGPADSGEYARVELVRGGRIRIKVGSTPNGQGHITAWSQIAADVFAVSTNDVDVIAGDTNQVSQGWGSMASRSVQIGGSAVLRTSRTLWERARQVASEVKEVDAKDLIRSPGGFTVAGVPDAVVTLAEVAQEAIAQGVDLSAEEFYSPGAQTFPYGVHAAVVEVNIETGEIRLLAVAAVDDCGNALNPMMVDGQVHGSLAQGIGQALFEEVRYDAHGQLLTSTLMDYALPRAGDLPLFDTDRVVTPAPSNPLGAKGAGEAGCIGAPPAVVNAVLDALHYLGVTHIDMPLRPANVWSAIRQARNT